MSVQMMPCDPCWHCYRMLCGSGTRLNPLADEFVPKERILLNPRAEAFTPKGSFSRPSIFQISDSPPPKNIKMDLWATPESPISGRPSLRGAEEHQVEWETDEDDKIDGDVKHSFLVRQIFGHLSDDDKDSDEDLDDDEEEWDCLSQTSYDDDVDREFLHPLQLQSFSVPVLPSKKKTEDKESSIDHHPSQVSKCEVNQRIKEANKTWRKNYEVKKNTATLTNTLKNTRRVEFSGPESWTYYEEYPNLMDDLKSSRVSDWPQRKADHARMEKLLSPILDQSHREKIFQRNYGCTN